MTKKVREYPPAPKDPLDLLSEEDEGSAVFTMLPEVAKVWLEEMNTKNRPLQRSSVEGIVRSIRDGRWEKTHQGIGISTEMTLLDGQHRLAAIAEAGIPVPIRVTWGEAPRTFAFIDSGKKRTGADTLAISGLDIANPNLAASVVRHVSYIDRGYGLDPFVSTELSITNDRVESEIRRIGVEKIARAVATGSRHQNADIRFTGTVVGAPAYFIVESGADTEVLEKFFTSVSSGLGIMDADDPRHALRRYLERRSKMTNTQRARIEAISTVIRAWNMWSTGQKAKNFRDPKSVPEVVPPRPLS